MMGSSVKIHYSGGLWIKSRNYSILIDPSFRISPYSKPNLIAITHGHTDHIGGVHKVIMGTKLVVSKPTLHILGSKGSKFSTIIMNSKDVEVIDGIIIEALNAGHVVGSLQYTFDNGEMRIGFTGDINVKGSLTEPPAEIMSDVDILIIEATYGSPRYVFPEREDIYNSILDWIERNINKGILPVLAGYPLGKGQELTKLVTKYVGIQVLVCNSVYRYNKIFEINNSNSLGPYSRIKSNEALKSDTVIISSSNNIGRIRELIKNINDKIKIAICTGWAINKSFWNYDKAFPLSAHSDFNDLINYVEEVRPKRVYTLYGHKVILAREIRRRLGIVAEPL